MRVATVEGVPLCVPCGGQRLSAQTAAGESEWWSPSVACVDVTRRAPLGGIRVFVPGARGRCVSPAGAQPVRAPDARTRTRVRRNARLGCAQRLSRLPSRRSGARGLFVVVSQCFFASVMFCALVGADRSPQRTARTSTQSVSFVVSFVAPVPPRSPTFINRTRLRVAPPYNQQRTVNPLEILTSLTWLLSEG